MVIVCTQKLQNVEWNVKGIWKFVVILKPLCNGLPLWLVGGEPETIHRALVAIGFARRWHIQVPGLPGGGRSDLPSGGILSEWLTCTRELCARRSRWTAVTPGSWSQILVCLSTRGSVYFSIWQLRRNAQSAQLFAIVIWTWIFGLERHWSLFVLEVLHMQFAQWWWICRYIYVVITVDRIMYVNHYHDK